MATKGVPTKLASIQVSPKPCKTSSLLDMHVVYCDDNVEKLATLPDRCLDLIYVDPPFNSNRNYDAFSVEPKACPDDGAGD